MPASAKDKAPVDRMPEIHVCVPGADAQLAPAIAGRYNPGSHLHAVSASRVRASHRRPFNACSVTFKKTMPKDALRGRLQRKHWGAKQNRKLVLLLRDLCLIPESDRGCAGPRVRLSIHKHDKSGDRAYQATTAYAT